MLKSFIKFSSAAKDGTPTSITLAIDSIIAIENSLTSGLVLIPGAAFTTTAAEAMRLSNEVTGNGSKNAGQA